MDTLKLLGVVVVIFMVLVMIASIVFMIAAQWRIFKKAGQPGWACIVPIYSVIVFLRIIGKPWWWMFLLLIPIVNIIYLIWAANLLSLSFGKDEGFTVGLLLAGVVFVPILGFGKATYKGPAGLPKQKANI